MKRTASLLMILLILVSVLLPTAFAAGTVSYAGDAEKFVFAPGSDHSPTDLFGSFKDVMPGDTLTEQITIKNDAKNANKPAQVIEKIVAGRIGKFYEESCLLNQSFVKEQKISVAEYVAQTAKALGGDIKVLGYTRFEKGEGLEKREDNFADEVAKMTGQA